ncbi:MAG: type II secretion system F family protein [Candidatus Margulisiibacteriota bacterium]
MPLYNYKAIDSGGKVIQAVSEALSSDAVFDKLASAGSTVISITEKKDALNLKFVDEFLKRLIKVKIDELVMFSLQLSNMLGAGLSLPIALSTIEKQTENKKLKAATKKISESINQGKTLSESLAQHRDIFSNLFINMIAAGEAGGNLDEILTRISSYIEHEASLKQKISSAMMYPVILLVAGLLVVTFVVTTVIPPFVKIFSDSGIPLPLPTMMLYQLNNIIRSYWHIGIALLTAGWFGLNWWGKTSKGKMALDRFKLKLPLWGDLLRKVEIARLTKTLSALLSSGIPMIQALQVTENTINLAPMAAAIKEVNDSVGKGENISKPLEASRQFPPMVIHMIAVGEETGTLEVMLSKVSDFYDLSTEITIKKVTSLLEPMFLVIIGGLVGFIFASILLPIFGMVKTLRQ